MRPHTLPFILFTLLSGCALEDIEKFNECSQPQGIIISSFDAFDAQATEASQDKLAQDKCPNDYPQCVLWGPDSHACSKCEPGKLFCDGQCVPANSDTACGKDCEHLVKCSAELKCMNNECACENGGFSNGTTCNRPDDIKTCGASRENPDGMDCEKLGQICQNQACICENGGVTDGSKCNDPNDIKTCGATKQNPTGTDCSPLGQICQNQTCVCENGGVTDGSKCNDPNADNTCGASRDNPAGTDCTETGRSCQNQACLCPNGKAYNGYECVTTSDSEHCGASQDNPIGTRCRDDQKCIWNTELNNFACTCTNQTFEANNACVDPNNDATCGATPDNPLGTTCENDQTCTSGKCKCNNPKMIKCGTKCIFPQSDPHHCGARGQCNNERNNHPDYIGDICDEAAGQECINNHCGCQGELIYCDGKCINPSNDNAHCGMFNTTCEKLVTCPANATCTDGTCKCDTGYAHCGNSNTCVPNGETNCGARGGCTSTSASSPDYAGIDCTKYNDLTCQTSTGICIPKTDKSVKCDPLRTCTSDGAFTGCANTSQFKDNTCNSCGSNDLCGSSCSELLGTKTNCSACGDSCGSGQTCQRVSDKYQCQCARAQDGRELSKCGNTCVDLQFSQANCGKCGNECADDEFCIKGVCQPLECEENQYFCLGACRNQ
ncbi:MAG: hypothetical protein IJ268_00135, partial [Proteobacteria bacterium]|nr:hypothetical protein [Pseudomonadota bacterium]